jgi:cytochrome c biogenesis protein CcdA
VSACSVGYSLAALGKTISLSSDWVLLAGLVVGGVLLGAEGGYVPFRPTYCRRQTIQEWGSRFGLSVASAMWGFHIGLGFATSVTFTGFWFVVYACVAWGDPKYGATLMLMYWIGRALPVWLAPTLVRVDPSDDLFVHVTSAPIVSPHTSRRLVIVTLLWVVALLWMKR